MKKTSIYLTQETTDKINALAKMWGLPDKRHSAAVIRRAINEMHRQALNSK